MEWETKDETVRHAHSRSTNEVLASVSYLIEVIVSVIYSTYPR